LDFGLWISIALRGNRTKLITFLIVLFILDKPLGATPLEMIRRLKTVRSELADTPMTYAGRLDPMAEGVLLILAGDDVHSKDTYLALEKEYVAQLVFGFTTDTGDLLGLAERASGTTAPAQRAIAQALSGMRGEFTFRLPPFSSFKVSGKPLFAWAREGRLNEIEIPERTVSVHEAELVDMRSISQRELADAGSAVRGAGHRRTRRGRSLFKRRGVGASAK
jgi:tRNA pseudouridine55 synthase